MTKLLSSNAWQYRLLRTIIQSIIGCVIANLDLIVESLNFSPSLKPVIVALCMAILSPIMAEIGKHQEDKLEAEKRASENSYILKGGDDD